MGRPQACNCLCSPLLVDTIRGIECIGPVFDGDTIDGHTTDWRWDRIFVQNQGGSEWGNRNLWAWTWFQTPLPVATLYKMRPIRFSCMASSDYYIVGSGGPSKRQMSALSPPATSDGHFSGSVLDSITFGRGIISTMRGNSSSRIVATRVLIDGVDVTGIVPSDVRMAIYLPIAGPIFHFGAFWSNEFTLTFPLVTIPSASTIWLDLWVENRLNPPPVLATSIMSSEATGITNELAGPIIAAYGSTTPYLRTPFGPVMDSGKINVHRRLSAFDRWQLTFTGGTVGGVASLTMEPQAGWNFLRNGPLVSMTKTTGAGAGDSVSLRYDTETPEIIVRLWSQLLQEMNGAGGQFTGRMRYSILSPSYYGPSLFSGGALGPITASGTNTFIPTSRGWYGSSWMAIEQTVAAQRAGFPTQITAVRS